MNAQRRVAVSAACHIVGHKRFAISTAKPVCVGSCIARSRGNRSRACKDVDRYSGAPYDDRAAVRYVRCTFLGAEANSEGRRGTLPSDRPGSLHRTSLEHLNPGGCCCTVVCSTASTRAARLHSRQRPRLSHTLLRHHRLRSQRRRPTWPVPRPLVSNRLCGHLSGAVQPTLLTHRHTIVFAALLAPPLSTLSGTDSISQLKDLGEARSQLAEVGVRHGSCRLEARSHRRHSDIRRLLTGAARVTLCLSTSLSGLRLSMSRCSIGPKHWSRPRMRTQQSDRPSCRTWRQEEGEASSTASESRCWALPFRSDILC